MLLWNADELTEGAANSMSLTESRHSSADIELPFNGGCVCGEVRYECNSLPLVMVKCHCLDCQRVSGGPYAPVLSVPLTSFRVTRGEMKRFATTRISGKPNLRGFCANCGSRLTVGEDLIRNLVGIMAGSLDDPGLFKPNMDIFVRDAQRWDLMDAILPKHDQYMPRK